MTDDLAKIVRQALAEASCEPHWLEIEVTESLLIDDCDRVRTTMQLLTEMGLTVAIDDFGPRLFGFELPHPFRC